jgi:Fe-S cluster assembly iron-binding protein IscA
MIAIKDNAMLNVTEPAGAHLARLLSESDAPEDSAARLVSGQGGLTLQLDTPREGDELFEHDGRTILLIDPNVSELVEDKTLALHETEEGTALALE